jgi:hypothetical protein
VLEAFGTRVTVGAALKVQGGIVTIHHPTSMAYAGLLDRGIAKVFGELSEVCAVIFTACVPGIPSMANKKTSSSSSPSKVFITLYGFRKDSDCVGTILDDAGVFLQHPECYDDSVRYDNPHYLTRPGNFLSVSEAAMPTAKPPKPSTILSDHDPLKSQVLEIFDSAQGPLVYQQAAESTRLRTPLKRQGPEADHRKYVLTQV